MSRLATSALGVVLAACAGDLPYRTDFDDSGGVVEVVVLADGFVRCGGERVPLEAAVLDLRQRTRAMDDDELERLVVRLSFAPESLRPEAAGRAGAARDRLLDELFIMGVKQVRYL